MKERTLELESKHFVMRLKTWRKIFERKNHNFEIKLTKQDEQQMMMHLQ